ncbi:MULTISPECIES: flagellar basal-body rod protein FlgG [unclassified Marinobacter]|uniref:flagellar basal-body rod protein FlgG n=1 Tax=unclassified Marinobacter TaxID=83889 RepID=UPI00200E5420|nr:MULTISPECIES: flagellar basal-body rod protein FlgG [unclassified Marinobacter]MCL1478699.1 flagellar basal-body rod protein FlgG [Marinobacter sp.]MCL1484290.1 flagellar basal-body rod protein FlgG [Marinobacter sp.]MCL1488185.1 flagellar basal-body rod protein FlgG [Marinobacter sp.]UQG57819.1 flagellar basal-body rod protein FlgG [Marinobacter sp. M4C]UQG66624.1 flagellar basal-body rod protein FlgG [Marinobacter sp. M2C]
MHPALWVSKTGLSAQDTNMSTISNNLANVNTTGFKRDRAVFQDLLYQVKRQPGGLNTQNTELPSGLQLGTGVRVVGTAKQFTQGNLQITEQPLDMAVNGRGFLQVQLPDGQTAYTRDGQFQLNSDGDVVNPAGNALQPNINIPANATNVTIGRDGTVTAVTDDQAAPINLGQITLVDFINPQGLQAIGNNLFKQTNASGDPTEGEPGLAGLGTLEQGSIESSNVEVVEELVNMITTQRAYEMNSKVVSTVDQMLQFITNNIG